MMDVQPDEKQATVDGCSCNSSHPAGHASLNFATTQRWGVVQVGLPRSS
jgi:hypothetical protein